MSPRLRALSPYLAVALLPAAVFLLAAPSAVVAMMALMWVLLLVTVGLAATSPGGDKPPSWGSGPRLRS